MATVDDRGGFRLAVKDLAIGQIGPLDLSITAGETVGLSGPSGAGKSRLLRAIADLEPHSGQCWLDGEPQHAMSAPTWRRQVGLLPAESRWWQTTANDHLPATLPAAIEDWAEILGLTAALRTRPIDRLSSGQRQRAALLRLLAHQPRVLLLDEPTANLDAENIARVERLLADYIDRAGASALWVSHDPSQRRRVAERSITIDHDGRVHACN